MDAVRIDDWDAYLKQQPQRDLDANMALIVRVLQQTGREYLPDPEKEYKFHPEREFRFDYAWPHTMIAIEIEGGIWQQTETGRSKGHAHPVRFLQDMEKYNEAARFGWRVFRFTPEQLTNGDVLAFLEKVFRPFGEGVKE